MIRGGNVGSTFDFYGIWITKVMVEYLFSIFLLIKFSLKEGLIDGYFLNVHLCQKHLDKKVF